MDSCRLTTSGMYCRLGSLLEEHSHSSTSPLGGHVPSWESSQDASINVKETKARASILAKAVRKSNFAKGLRRSLFNAGPPGGMELEEDCSEGAGDTMGATCLNGNSLGLPRATSAPATLPQSLQAAGFPSGQPYHMGNSLGFTSAPVVSSTLPHTSGPAYATAPTRQHTSVCFNLPEGRQPPVANQGSGMRGPNSGTFGSTASVPERRPTMYQSEGGVRGSGPGGTPEVTPEKQLLQKRATLRPTWGGGPPPWEQQRNAAAENEDEDEVSLTGLALQLKKELKRRASLRTGEGPSVAKPLTGSSSRTPPPPPPPPMRGPKV